MSASTPRFVPDSPSGQVGVDATSTRQPSPALAEAVEQARAAAQAEAGEETVGDHVGVHAEDDYSATHHFVATHTGYVGWRWAVTVADAGPGTPVTVSEVVLLPGADALVAPEWLPWDQRVRAGDLGVGDLLPAAPDDPRLMPGYLASDDPAVEEVAKELGLGRRRILGRHGRVETARRWVHGDFGPEAQMARSAPAHCGSCGFYLPLAGSLRAAFGACGNEMAPADGRVVHAEYGCGAHSDAEVDNASPVPVAEVVFDDAGVELIPVGAVRALGSESEDPADTEDTADTEGETASDDGAAESGEQGTTESAAASAPVAAEQSTAEQATEVQTTAEQTTPEQPTTEQTATEQAAADTSTESDAGRIPGIGARSEDAPSDSVLPEPPAVAPAAEPAGAELDTQAAPAEQRAAVENEPTPETSATSADRPTRRTRRARRPAGKPKGSRTDSTDEGDQSK
ncbi:DUF3027 domain-containing protein [Actinoalloteichus hymeniacidonis]|uniref:DUF3027 family protein n=1 Tax=Actinoalloteichus hymeniacidonis TaxID=340345 RepID=A0AAC9N1F4_9PSEU|nr:DUF3027 domain-containing protein [Actinoalloteichus hymeniacidonis]AOS65821.1 putative DUF3027 family protein [Actinoalloteichus hymeniacidonis]MBB5906088.1 hypothetical protein [Actinoalloteichus hymeniacidonis]